MKFIMVTKEMSFCYKYNFLIPTSLQPIAVNLWCVILRTILILQNVLFENKMLKVYDIGLKIYRDSKNKVCATDIIPLCTGTVPRGPRQT